MPHIQTNSELNGHVHCKLEGQLSICFESNQVPDGVGEDCPIHVTCETASCSSSKHISLVSLKQSIAYWPSLKQYIRAIISKYGTFSCTEFYLVMFSNCVSFFLASCSCNKCQVNWLHSFEDHDLKLQWMLQQTAFCDAWSEWVCMGAQLIFVLPSYKLSIVARSTYWTKEKQKQKTVIRSKYRN